MTYDIELGIHEIRRARRQRDPLTAETARLGDQVADHFREEFGSELDMETCGKAMVVAAASVVPLVDPEIPPAVLINLIGMAGENLVRQARQSRPGVGR